MTFHPIRAARCLFFVAVVGFPPSPFYATAASAGETDKTPNLEVFRPPPPPPPNRHWVGLFNTIMPGGGQFLLGNYGDALLQFGLEGLTFGVGYSMSRLSPMTIDGVPEDLPVRTARSITIQNPCAKRDSKGRCLLQGSTRTSTTTDESDHDFSKPLAASLLQEFAIKYHMVNVFEAYRTASTVNGKLDDSWIDPRPTRELFMDPFRIKNLTNPWVYVPLALVAGVTLLDYRAQVDTGVTAISKMDTFSNILFGLNYMAAQPIGSGAPEEMFYRGYLQNEFYHLVQSPFFSVPMSTLAFAFSHAAPGRLSSGVSGLYLGTLAHINHGNLAPGIALHFWSVVILGIETFILTYHAQSDLPVGGQIQLAF